MPDIEHGTVDKHEGGLEDPEEWLRSVEVACVPFEELDGAVILQVRMRAELT